MKFNVKSSQLTIVEWIDRVLCSGFVTHPEAQWNNERIARQRLGDRRETLAPRAADLHVVWVAETPILNATGDRDKQRSAGLGVAALADTYNAEKTNNLYIPAVGSSMLRQGHR